VTGWLVRMEAWVGAAFLASLACLNVAHPLFHIFEGGQVDMVLDYLNAVAAQIASTRTP